jgi:hypothetical protein
MAVPQSRAEFGEYCLRRLGKPVIQINVADEHVDDAIDYALKKFADYHFDATEKVYYKHQITAFDKTRKFITLPDNVIGAVNIFDYTSFGNVQNPFNIEYQIMLNDLYTLTSQSMLPYYMTMYQLQSLQEMLVGKKPIRYNRYKNELRIDTNWDRFNTGDYLIVECYGVVDPEEYSKIWSDTWLIQYTTAQIKLMWGQILTKFSGAPMPGGVMYNGERILSDAQKDIEQLEETLINSYSLPIIPMVG